MAHRIPLEIPLQLDGISTPSETRFSSVGPAVVVVETVIPDADIAGALHSTYLGHPAGETVATHLWVARDRAPEIAVDRHEGHQLPIYAGRTPLILEHLVILHERLAAEGRTLSADSYQLAPPARDA